VLVLDPVVVVFFCVFIPCMQFVSFIGDQNNYCLRVTFRVFNSGGRF